MRGGQVWPQRLASALLDSVVKPSQPKKAPTAVNEPREVPLTETQERTENEPVPARFQAGFPGEEDLQGESALNEQAVNTFFETASASEPPLAVGWAMMGCLLPLCPRCFGLRIQTSKALSSKRTPRPALFPVR
jgi:hypothetical protein